MASSLADIDQLIADWQHNIQIVSQNLLELQALPIVQTLSSSQLSLTGQTEIQVQRAVAAIDELFNQFSLLSDSLAQAISLRQDLNPYFPSEARIQEIQQLFALPTITLRSSRQPLAQRGLLGAAEVVESVTPTVLLNRMIETFTWTKDIVLALDQAWLNLEPELTALQGQINRLRNEAQQLGLSDPQALSQATDRLNDLRDRVLADPLGSQTDLQAQIQPLIQGVEKTLAILGQQTAQLSQQFAQAEQQLQQLQSQNRQILALYDDSQLKVSNIIPPLQPPLSPESIAALETWLDRLKAKQQEGLIQPILVGIANWLGQAQGLLLQQSKAIAANEAPLQQRLELRGRLDALQAKAKAKGRAEDPQLSQWGSQAKDILYSRPSNLGEAIGLITAYERHLNKAPHPR
jgi:hypothetical protein